MKLPKTSLRRLLYLITIITACLLGLLVSNARLQFYRDTHKANQKLLSTHLKQDTESAQYYFYANYRLDTDNIEKFSTLGSNATFINVCKDSCALFKGKELLKSCSDLSSQYQFDKHRVYKCNVKVTLENDQPLRCEAIDNRTFNIFCGNYIAFLKR